MGIYDLPHGVKNNMLERLAPYVESFVKNKKDPKDSYKFLSSRIVKRYLKKYHLLKIKKFLKYSYDNSPYYHDLFNRQGIKPSDIKSLKDISKIPPTSSNDILDAKKFFAVDESKFVKIFSSSGTTGLAKRIFFTKKDLDNQISNMATGMSMLYKITKNDVVRITYDHGYGADDWGVRYCLERAIMRIGAMPVITSTRLPAEKELDLLKNYKVSVIMGTPSYLNSLTYDLEKLINLSTLKIKSILVGTEPLPSKIRQKLEKTWNTDVYQGYGMTEMGTSVAGECGQKNGMHITENAFHAEIIDPKTGKVLEDGEIGEVVLTTLARDGMPLIRYRTHDLGILLADECECGLPFKRIKIKGRTDKMVTIGSGDNIYPEAFDKVLFSLPFLIDYQIILEKKNNKDVITVVVESKKLDKKLEKDIVEKILSLPEIENGLNHSKTIKEIKVNLVKPNTLDRDSIKFRRLKDNRNLYD